MGDLTQKDALALLRRFGKRGTGEPYLHIQICGTDKAVADDFRAVLARMGIATADRVGERGETYTTADSGSVHFCVSVWSTATDRESDDGGDGPECDEGAG